LFSDPYKTRKCILWVNGVEILHVEPGGT